MTDDLAGTESLEETGPIDYLVVEFPRTNFTGEAFPLLLDLVDNGTIRILDLVFVIKDDDGQRRRDRARPARRRRVRPDGLPGRALRPDR